MRAARMFLVTMGLAAMSSCIDTPTSTFLTFRRAADTPSLSALSVTVWNGNGLYQPAARFPDRGALEPPNGDVLGTLVIYGRETDGALRIQVRGLNGAGAVVAEGSAIVKLSSGRQQDTAVVLPTGRLPDRDVDGVADDLDNCPKLANPLQEDWDGDLKGDACGDGRPAPTDAAGTDAPADKTKKVRPTSAGNALQFDGANDHVPLPRRIDGDFTIEMWIKTTVVGTGKTARDGVSLAINTAPRATQTFALTVLNGKLAFATGEDAFVSSTSPVNTGAWVHVAATRSAADGLMRVMVNGVEEGSTLGTTRPLVDAPTIELGGLGSAAMFSGIVDELRIWNIARPASDIARDRARILGGTEVGLVSYYRFDDPPGSLAASDDAPAGGSSVLGGNATGQQPEWISSTAPLAP